MAENTQHHNSLKKYLDDKLREYYRSLGRLDYAVDGQHGLFLEYLNDDGFDSEAVNEELDCDIEDCGFLEFDDDFPVNEGVTDHEIKQYLFDLLRKFREEYHESQRNNKELQQQQLIDANNVDFKIFEDAEISCFEHPQSTPITKRCNATLRLCTAMRYSEAIHGSKVLDDETKHILFVEFNEMVYGSVLEDMTHFVTVHSKDVRRVHTEWTQRYGVPKCFVSECTKSVRHYQRGMKEIQVDINEHDEIYSFYESLYDRLHFFTFHLYDVGLRVALSRDIENDEEEPDSVDNVFAVEREQIKSRRSRSALGGLYERNDKFSIRIGAKDQGVTMMDALRQKMMKSKCAPPEALRRLKCFMDTQSFDSDCIQFDVEEYQDSNLCAQSQSLIAVQFMADFVRTSKPRRRAFSTGFVFNYWDENDKMFVKPRHENLKEEIVGSGFVSTAQWREFVELKARKYMATEAVREMRAGRALKGTRTGHLSYGKYEWNRNTLRYGFSGGDALSAGHLQAIILHCDWTDLCSAFSDTFRLSDAFEKLKSLLKRHSHFAHLGRLLVELVVDFGINGFKHERYKPTIQQGPFFCRLNSRSNIGAFAIKLQGPCSTSMLRSVALNFAMNKGIILKLDNDGGEFYGSDGAETQTLLNCSWISNFAEEAECLWIAGTECLRIASITLIHTARCYSRAIKALYFFDAMISGVDIGYQRMKIKCDEADKALIAKLIELELSGTVYGFWEFDAFLRNEWKLFLQQKTEMYLKLGNLAQRFPNLSHLALEKVRMNRKAIIGNDNVLRADFLSIFPSLEIVRIDTCFDFYKFDLRKLLKVMESVPCSVTWMIEGKDWVKFALTDEVRVEFGERGWKLDCNVVVHEDGAQGKLLMKHESNNE